MIIHSFGVRNSDINSRCVYYCSFLLCVVVNVTDVCLYVQITNCSSGQQQQRNCIPCEPFGGQMYIRCIIFCLNIYFEWKKAKLRTGNKMKNKHKIHKHTHIMCVSVSVLVYLTKCLFCLHDFKPCTLFFFYLTFSYDYAHTECQTVVVYI